MIHLAANAILLVVPFLFVLTLVVTIHELGHFWVARALGIAVDRFSIGFGRTIFSWTDRKGIEWRIGWIPLGGYVRFGGDGDGASTVPDREGLDDLKRRIVLAEGVGAEKKYFHFKPIWARALVVVAGPMANFVLAVTIFAILLMSFGAVVIKPRVGEVDANSPAARAQFHPGDVILSANGRATRDFDELVDFVRIRSGEQIDFAVRRGPQVVHLFATPERNPKLDGLGSIGIHPSREKGDIYRKQYPLPQAVAQGARRSWDIVNTTVTYLGRLATGKESGKELGGPLGIASAASTVAKAGGHAGPNPPLQLLYGFMAVLELAGVISVGIGFMNLLPIPVLDGGHLVFYAYEAVARRPMAARIQSLGYRVGLAMLSGFMLFATWNDLQRLNVFKIFGGPS